MLRLSWTSPLKRATSGDFRYLRLRLLVAFCNNRRHGCIICELKFNSLEKPKCYRRRAWVPKLDQPSSLATGRRRTTSRSGGKSPRYDERYRAEAAGPILNKAGQFAASPALKNIAEPVHVYSVEVGKPVQAWSIRQAARKRRPPLASPPAARQQTAARVGYQ